MRTKMIGSRSREELTTTTEITKEAVVEEVAEAPEVASVEAETTKERRGSSRMAKRGNTRTERRESSRTARGKREDSGATRTVKTERTAEEEAEAAAEEAGTTRTARRESTTRPTKEKESRLKINPDSRKSAPWIEVMNNPPKYNIASK